jgi:hypothetical protein
MKTSMKISIMVVVAKMMAAVITAIAPWLPSIMVVVNTTIAPWLPSIMVVVTNMRAVVNTTIAPWLPSVPPSYHFTPPSYHFSPVLQGVVLQMLQIIVDSCNFHYITHGNLSAWGLERIWTGVGLCIAACSFSVTICCRWRIDPGKVEWRLAAQLVVFIWSCLYSMFYVHQGSLHNYIAVVVVWTSLEICCVYGGDGFTEHRGSKYDFARLAGPAPADPALQAAIAS